MPAALSLVRSSGLASPRTVVGFLQRVQAFKEQPARSLEQLASRVDVRRVRRGAPIWRAGDAASDVFWVRSGVARTMQPAGPEREVTVDYHGRGELLGVLADGQHADDAFAHEDLTLLAISATDFQAWMTENAGAATAIVRLVAQSCRRHQQRLALVTMNGAKARLAALLLDLSDRFGVRDSRGVIVDLRLTHREMASLIGATRETVSVAIVELRSDEVVRTEHRRVILLDEDRLRQMAGHDLT